jgi:mutator protein MutT
MKHLDVAVAIVFCDFKVLITRRKAAAVLGGCWEFPGGKVEPGESLQNCVRRELLEELALVVHPVVACTPTTYQYPDRIVRLHPFLCTYEPAEPQLLGCDEYRWVTPAQLRDFEFPPANHCLIDDLVQALPQRHPSLGISPGIRNRPLVRPSSRMQGAVAQGI